MADLARSPRPVPTLRALTCAGVLLGCALLAPFVPVFVNLCVVGAAVLAVLLAVDWLLRPRPGYFPIEVEWANRRVIVARATSGRFALRNDGEADVLVTIRGLPPSTCDGEPWMASGVRVRAGDSLSHEWDFTPLTRGEHAWPPIGIGATRGLGMLEFRWFAPVIGGDELRAVPGRPRGELGHLISRAAILEQLGSRRMRRLGGEWEFANLRDYVIGDELRRIDWKASARHHRPAVREFESERAAETVLAIDNGRIMGSLIDGVRKVDLAMTPLLDLAAVALRRGERVGLLAFDDRPRAMLPPRPGMPQMGAMTEALATLGECTEASSYMRALTALDARQRRRSMIVVFTDFTDEVSATELVTSVAALRRRHIVVFVAVGDPHVRGVFEDRGRSEAELFERAAAGDLLVERRRVLDRLERLGVHTLDAEPARISGPLINRFLDLRLGREARV